MLPCAIHRINLILDEVDGEILQMLKEFRAHETKKLTYIYDDSHQTAVEFNVTIPRTAISLLEESFVSNASSYQDRSVLPGSSSSSVNVVYTPAFTVVLYGMHISYQRGSMIDDGLMNIRVGSARGFGSKGVSLLSCGKETDFWLNNYDIESLGSRDIALYCNLEWSTVKDIDDVGNEDSADEGKAELVKKLNLNPSKKHIVLELTTSAPIILQWDEKTVVYLTELLNDPIHIPSGISTIEQIISPIANAKRPFGDVKQKCANVSLNNTKKYSMLSSNRQRNLKSSVEVLVKWSVDISIKGVVFDISYDALPPSNYTSTSIDPFSKSPLARRRVRFSLGLLQLQGGDYFVNSTNSGAYDSIDEDSLSDIPSRELWGHVDKILRHKLKRINSPLLHTLIVNLQDLECSLLCDYNQEENALEANISAISSTAQSFGFIPTAISSSMQASQTTILKLTTSPWGIKGLVSLCAIPCHAIHPELQLDMFASPLHFTCSTEVSIVAVL